MSEKLPSPCPGDLGTDPGLQRWPGGLAGEMLALGPHLAGGAGAVLMEGSAPSHVLCRHHGMGTRPPPGVCPGSWGWWPRADTSLSQG